MQVTVTPSKWPQSAVCVYSVNVTRSVQESRAGTKAAAVDGFTDGVPLRNVRGSPKNRGIST